MHISPLLIGGGLLLAFYLGARYATRRARRLYRNAFDRGEIMGEHAGFRRGYRRGSRDAEAIAKRALLDLNDMHCVQMAELVRGLTGTEVPVSDEVAREAERRES